MKFLDNLGASMYKSSLEHFTSYLESYKKEGTTGLRPMLWFWKFCEKGYAKKGFRPLDLHEFVPLLSQGYPIDHLLNQKLENGRKPVLYASELNQQEIKNKLEELLRN